ncbi:hypothetical protein H4R35_004729 [Dimargaris xerosporica]|nr:hypothetical protein H4R35_004729 [Dimargaris xerosporica]
MLPTPRLVTLTTTASSRSSYRRLRLLTRQPAALRAALSTTFLAQSSQDKSTESVIQGRAVSHESTLPQVKGAAEVDVVNAKTAAVDVFQQAPNHAQTWSRNQRPRSVGMTGPRFEQVDLDAQPRPLAAIDLIAEEPIRFVKGRRAVCDGGGGPLGHPTIFINLDQADQPHACGYCGLRFQQDPHHHH